MIVPQAPPNDFGSSINQYVSKYQSLIPSVLANLVTVFICILFYDVYLLLDEYFHTMVFSVLVGAAIKPLKDMTIQAVIATLYGNKLDDTTIESGILESIAHSNLLFESKPSVNSTTSDSQPQQEFTQETQTEGSPERSERKAHHNHEKHHHKHHSEQPGPSMTNVMFALIEQLVNTEDEIQRKQISREEEIAEKKKKITVEKVLKQCFNVLASAAFFYFLKGATGLIFLVTIFVVDYLASIVRHRFAHRIDPFVASLRSMLQRLVSRDAMEKTLSQTFSCCCIIFMLFILVGATIFTVYKVQNDIMNIKKGIQKSNFAKDFTNYTSSINITALFNTSLVKSIQSVNVTEQINNIFQSRQHQITADNRHCIRTIKHYTKDFIPQFITTRACIIYSEISINSLKSYISYFGSFAGIFQSVLTFSLSHVFSVINYFFLYVFKCFVFMTTTYYIIEDFNIESSLDFIGRLFQGEDKRHHKDKRPQLHKKQSFAESFILELKSIMLASLFISFAHFVLSWVMLDIFEVSEFNFVVSLVLGGMALVPLYRPWLGATAVSVASYFIGYNNHHFMLVLFSLIYYATSNQIFSRAYSKISIPSVLTNLSVILGIYSYGIIGVVYGPLILTIIKRIFQACRDH